jgi:hypothetical protein
MKTQFEFWILSLIISLQLNSTKKKTKLSYDIFKGQISFSAKLIEGLMCSLYKKYQKLIWVLFFLGVWNNWISILKIQFLEKNQ